MIYFWGIWFPQNYVFKIMLSFLKRRKSFLSIFALNQTFTCIIQDQADYSCGRTDNWLENVPYRDRQYWNLQTGW